jgi:hypothetical protein
LSSSLETSLVVVDAGPVGSQGDGGDVLEDEAGIFIGEGDVEVGAHSHLGLPLLLDVVVLHHQQGLVEGEGVLLSEAGLNKGKCTSTPYLMFLSCWATTSSL